MMPDRVMSIDKTEFNGYLKPCPFCGGEAEMREGGSFDRGYTYTASCLHTNCRGFDFPGGDRYDTPAKAAEAWNKRYEEPDTAEKDTGEADGKRWWYTDEGYEKFSKALDECQDLTRMPRGMWDFIMDTYDRLAVPNPDKMTDDQKKLKWELICAEGNDWKYGRMMVCREKKIVRNLTFDEFYGGAVVD